MGRRAKGQGARRTQAKAEGAPRPLAHRAPVRLTAPELLHRPNGMQDLLGLPVIEPAQRYLRCGASWPRVGLPTLQGVCVAPYHKGTWWVAQKIEHPGAPPKLDATEYPTAHLSVDPDDALVAAHVLRVLHLPASLHTLDADYPGTRAAVLWATAHGSVVRGVLRPWQVDRGVYHRVLHPASCPDENPPRGSLAYVSGMPLKGPQAAFSWFWLGDVALGVWHTANDVSLLAAPGSVRGSEAGREGCIEVDRRALASGYALVVEEGLALPLDPPVIYPFAQVSG